MSMKEEEKVLKTDENFDETFKCHRYGRSFEQARGRDEEVRVTVFEHKGDCDETKAFVMLHGATSPANEKAYEDEADDLEDDEELENGEALAEMLKERGEKYHGYDLSFRESRRYENATNNWLRVSDKLGSKHPKYVVTISWGAFWVLSIDKQGKKLKSCTAENFNSLLAEALSLVGANVRELWLIGHSLGGLNQIALLQDQAKNKLTRYSKAFIADGLVFPGDVKQSFLLEWFLGGSLTRMMSRLVVEILLYEHEWREIDPQGKNHRLMQYWPPTLMHSNTRSMWPFSMKHYEMKKIALSLGANQIHLHTTPTTHSYFDSDAVADFLLNENFNTQAHDYRAPAMSNDIYALGQQLNQSVTSLNRNTITLNEMVAQVTDRVGDLEELVSAPKTDSSN